MKEAEAWSRVATIITGRDVGDVVSRDLCHEGRRARFMCFVAGLASRGAREIARVLRAATLIASCELDSVFVNRKGDLLCSVNSMT